MKVILEKEYHEIQHENTLPSIESLDSDTFQVNRRQLKSPKRPATRLGADTRPTSASFTPADFESLRWVWQQWYWGRPGTYFSHHRKCSSGISAISYTLLLLSATGIFIPVETQPDSNPAPKSDAAYRLRTAFVSRQSNTKTQRSC